MKAASAAPSRHARKGTVLAGWQLRLGNGDAGAPTAASISGERPILPALGDRARGAQAWRGHTRAIG